MSFATSYEVTPWQASLDKNTKTEYVPELLATFVKKSVFYRMITYSIDLGALHTNKVIFTQRFQPAPNIAPIDARSLWLPELYTDSRQIEITCSDYGDKVQIHKNDEWYTYWRENGVVGLRNIMRNLLAPHMVETLDLLARNAFLSAAFVTFGGDATGFNDLASGDTFSPAIARGVKLRMEYQPDVMDNPLFCITSPAATYAVRNDGSGEWLTRNQYANPSILVNGEIGMYEDCRFVTTPALTLWNCGPVINQTTITASITVGDGSPDPATTKVDDVWMVGQDGATHGITVADSSGFSVGQRVTLHTARPNANGQKATLNGVTWNSPYNLERRIVAIPNGTTLQFDEPITNNYYQTDLGAGVYGYVTYGRPVHAAIFLLGPDAVVAGVVQPPQTYEPPTVDDRMAIWRFSWDATLKYQPFYTNRFLVHFFAGPVDENGIVTTI